MEEEVEREIFMHISFHHSHHSVNERDVECFVVTQSTIYEIYLFIFLQMNTKTRHGRERELLMLLLFCSPSQRMSR